MSVVALALDAIGVPQTLSRYVDVSALDGDLRRLALGPAASQVAIKQLGTSGGGFFTAHSAHPFENPTPLSNLIEVVAILLVPVALTFTFGKLAGNMRQGVAIFAAMVVLLIAGMVVATAAERSGNPMVRDTGASQATTVDGETAPGGNMEGKEVRFGIAGSTNWAVYTTAASNGAVNAMHDSYTPIGGLVPLLTIATGEVIFGEVGAGLYGMLFHGTAAMFVAGLMGTRRGPSARSVGGTWRSCAAGQGRRLGRVDRAPRHSDRRGRSCRAGDGAGHRHAAEWPPWLVRARGLAPGAAAGRAHHDGCGGCRPAFGEDGGHGTPSGKGLKRLPTKT